VALAHLPSPSVAPSTQDARRESLDLLAWSNAAPRHATALGMTAANLVLMYCEALEETAELRGLDDPAGFAREVVTLWAASPS